MTTSQVVCIESLWLTVDNTRTKMTINKKHKLSNIARNKGQLSDFFFFPHSLPIYCHFGVCSIPLLVGHLTTISPLLGNLALFNSNKIAAQGTHTVHFVSLSYVAINANNKKSFSRYRRSQNSNVN